MASYTMQLREYIEAQTQYHNCKNTQEKIEVGRCRLFDFDYPIFDEDYKKIFETNFIRNFYMRELGFETEGLFKFQLETWLNIHLPYFNKLWESEMLKYNPLHNASIDTTHNKKNDKNQKDIRDTLQDSKSDSTMKHESESIGSGSQEQKGTNSTDNFERKLGSNNPDNRLALTAKDGEGVIEYASTIDEQNENNKGTFANDGKHSETNDSKESGQSGNVSKATQNDQLQSDINEIEDFVEAKVGKIGVVSYPKLVMEYRQALLRIEKQIFEEMQPLFMLVY